MSLNSQSIGAVIAVVGLFVAIIALFTGLFVGGIQRVTGDVESLRLELRGEFAQLDYRVRRVEQIMHVHADDHRPLWPPHWRER